MDHFNSLSLCESLLRALSEEGYQEPTSIQQRAIPELLAGHDLLATAQTGTGKTAAFALPILQLLSQRKPASAGIRALVLAPTRELALQIETSFRHYGRHLPLFTTAVFGGVPIPPQIRALKKKPDILIATPGRLLDLLRQGMLRLDRIEMLVLDEADRMLDMGFVPDVRRIIALTPKTRQTMLFSATISREIGELASFMLRSPSKVEVAPSASVADNISQKVLFVEQSQKRALLTSVLKDKNVLRALVFTRTKHHADRIVRLLSSNGISSDSIHSNKSQNARQRALAAFDHGKIRVLVATDIVARGIDVDGISHVINFELPHDPENYVHRIGRTARAGAAGTALSLCDAGEVMLLDGIEKLTRCPLTAMEDHPYHSAAIAALRTRKTSSHPLSKGFNGRRSFGPKRRFGSSRQAGREISAA